MKRIHCEQNQASERGLRQDVALSNQQILSETVSETQISNEHEVLNTDELRQRRLDHSWNVNEIEESSSSSTAKNVILKINRLHIKNDLIKEFQEKQTSFKLIVLKYIQAYLKFDRWHLKFNFISSVICIR